MKFSCYLYHIHFRSLLWGHSSLYRPFMGTLIRTFISENRRAHNIPMFDFATVQTNAFFDYGGFPLRAAMNFLHTSLRTPHVCYTVNSPPFATIRKYSHPSACCFSFLLLPVLQTIFKCSSWVIYLVATLAASRWTNLCLRSCCVPRIAIFDLAPPNRPVCDLLSPAAGVCVSMMSWYGIGEEEDYERKWEALSTL